MSKFSVKKPITVFVAVLLILILGVVSFTKMQTDLLPKLDLPYAVVMTTYIGASPEEVESVVTRPVEQSMATISNIKNISSVSQENVSLVILEFNTGTDMGEISLDLRESLDLLEAAWNSDMIGTPMIIKINPDMLPVMVAAVNVDGMNNTEVTAYLENELLARIESIEGVASVTVSGEVKQQINVVLSDEKLTAVGQKLSDKISEQFSDASAQLLSAQNQLKDGRTDLEAQKEQLTSGFHTAEEELTAAKEALDVKENELLTNKATLTEQKEELLLTKNSVNDALKTLSETEAQLLLLEKQSDETKAQLDTAKQELYSAEAELAASRTELEQGIEDIKNNSQLDEDGKETALVPLQEALKQLAERETQLADSKLLYAAQEESYLSAKAATEAARAEFDASKEELTANRTEINSGLAALNTSLLAIEEGTALIEDSRTSLAEKESELNDQKTAATSGLSEAETELIKGEEELAVQTSALEAAQAAALQAADLGSVLTSELISGLLAAQNFSMPAGYITEDGFDYLIRVGDDISDLTELQKLVLFDPGLEGVSPICLSDVADVFLTDNSLETYAKVNGNDGLLLSMEKQTSYSTAEVSDSIHERFEEISAEDSDFHVAYLMDQGVYIDMVIQSVLQNLGAGAILAILILFFFLKDLRPTAIIATSIPVSVIFAVVLMYFSGVTLNIISLSGLAVGVGMLVDNSIVVIENIYRLRSKGYNRVQSAVIGAGQVGGAITASTLTTVCVFLPIVFVEGLTRQLFVDMALTIAYSLLASLIVALTLVPAMASGMLLKVKPTRQPLLDRFRSFYEKALNWSLGHRAITLLIVVVLLVGSIFAALTRGTAYLPDMDSPQISVSMTIPKDATTEETYAYIDEATSRMLTIEEIDTVGAMVGGSTMSTLSGGSSVSIYIILKDDRSASSFEIASQINELCADLPCEISASGSSIDMSSLGGSGISIQVRGNDLQTLQTLSAQVADIVASVEGTASVSDGVTDPAPEYAITVDKEKAVVAGLTVAQVYAAIAKELSSSSSATSVTFDGTEYPVYVISPSDSDDITLTNLLNYEFTVTGRDQSESTVLLSDIAEITEQTGLSSISRSSQQRYLTVSASIADGYNIGLVSSDVEKALKDFELPDGYTLVSSGENDTINDAIVELIKMLLLAVVFIYLIMVAQFQSLLSPFIVMFTIPLAFTGGFLALFLTGNEISVIAMIGFVMLTGIIVNNGIVLVDYINRLRLEGKEKHEALIEAGLTRLRPILMTALTTILGLSTMAIGFGMGADLIQPVAIVTIGGLIYATFTTLFVVPVMYDLLHKKEMKKVSEEDLNATESDGFCE